MTLECLPEVLRDALDILCREQGFSIKAKLDLKNNVSSEISSSCKINVTELDRKLCLFVKYSSIKDRNNDFTSAGTIHFRNELVFYGEILTGFKSIQNGSANKTNHLPCTPGSLCVSPLQSEPYIIMEDLTTEGRIPMTTSDYLTAENARVVMHELGRFHAYSFAWRDLHPRTFVEATSKLSETVFSQSVRNTAGKLFIHAIHDSFKLAKHSLPSDSAYVEKFASFTLNVFDNMVDLVEGDNEDNEYKVVTHGDLWLHNILCKFADENKKINSVTFVDFQGCRLSSPVHDLMFVLLIGLDKLTREQNREDLIRRYHASLCECLEDLGCDPLRLFPYSTLQKQLLKHSQFALALALVGLPLFLNEGLNFRSNEQDSGSCDVGNVTDILLEFVQRLQSKKTMRCKNKMLEIIMDVIDQGYL